MQTINELEQDIKVGDVVIATWRDGDEKVTAAGTVVSVLNVTVVVELMLGTCPSRDGKLRGYRAGERVHAAIDCVQKKGPRATAFASPDPDDANHYK